MSIPRGSLTIQTTGANASLLADAQQCASWLTRAEGPVKPTAAVANAIVFYRESMARCLTCQSGQECEAHGTKRLRPAMSVDGPTGEECRRVTSVYFACFTDARGARPVFGDRDGVAVKQLIRSAGVERAEQAIRSAYSDPFWKDRVTIQMIASDPSRHLGDMKGQTKSTLQTDSGFQSQGEEVR